MVSNDGSLSDLAQRLNADLLLRDLPRCIVAMYFVFNGPKAALIVNRNADPEARRELRRLAGWVN
jgi:hypothetical protein